MAKVRKRKLKTSELEEVKKRTAGKSELEKAKKVLSKSKSKNDEVDRVAKEIIEIVSEKSTKKNNSKAKSKAKDKSKSKDKSKDKAKITTKEVKQVVKDLEMPKVLTTREVTKLIEEVTGYSLGQDLTAGAKNLRRYLRSLDQYNDGVNTNYRWSIKDDDDLKELSSILSYYSLKANKLG